MSQPDARLALIGYWFEKSALALAAAERERAAGDLSLAINRVYYACFYAVCAVLSADEVPYGKHSTVRVALHQHLVKKGRIAATWGSFYNRAFDDRQEADYEAVAEFDDATVKDRITRAADFIAELNRLATGGAKP